MEKLTIVLYSSLTVPAVLGGAVETLIEDFIEENERQKRFDITVIAHDAGKVRNLPVRYQYTRFCYITWPTIMIRAGSVLINRTHLEQIPDLWEELLIKAIVKTGNRKVLVEGGSRFAMKLKRRFAGMEIFYHLHADIRPFRCEAELKLYDSIYKICVSDYIRDCQIQAGADKRNIFVALNGVRTSRFDVSVHSGEREKICRRFGLDASKRHILFKGRIVPEKGILELLRAFRGIQDEDVELVICGSKNFGERRIRKSRYERDVKKMALRNPGVRMTGFVAYSQMPDLHKIADIIVVPSIWQEPCGLAVIEAVVSGVPLICSGTGGCAQICAGTKAVMVNPGGGDFVRRLNRAMRKLLDHPQLREEISQTQLCKRDCLDTSRYYQDMAKILERKRQI